MISCIILIISLNFIFSESALLRSKYLTDDMASNIEELDKYEKVARRVFNKYEKAKFYQIVAYTYHLKYENLAKELESLERQYQILLQDYSSEINLDFLKDNEFAGIQNAFVPILFSEDDNISIKLFKAKAGMFKKQYHEYNLYFNQKVNLYNKKLNQIKRPRLINVYTDQKKIYDDYMQFILNQESYNSEQPTLNTILDENNLISQINWSQEDVLFKRDFDYLSLEGDIKKTIDSKNNKIILETIYDVNIEEDDFISFLINEDIEHNFDYNGIFYNQYYNNLNEVFKIVYYSSSGNIIGCILKFFEEELKLVGENWYIEGCEKKIKELKNVYDPKTHKYIWLESKFIK